MTTLREVAERINALRSTADSSKDGDVAERVEVTNRAKANFDAHASGDVEWLLERCRALIRAALDCVETLQDARSVAAVAVPSLFGYQPADMDILPGHARLIESLTDAVRACGPDEGDSVPRNSLSVFSTSRGRSPRSRSGAPSDTAAATSTASA